MSEPSDLGVGGLRVASVRRLLRAEGERHYVAHKSVAYDVVLVVMTALYMVRKAMHKPTGQIRAIKFIDKSLMANNKALM